MHTHECDHCKTRVECDDALLESNHDGWPAVICRAVHQDAGVTEDVFCEDCAFLNACVWCNTKYDDQTHYPYCQSLCAVEAQIDSQED